jgi:hypothetical protein
MTTNSVEIWKSACEEKTLRVIIIVLTPPMVSPLYRGGGV